MYNEDAGTEGLLDAPWDKPWELDQLLFGDRLVIEVGPSRGIIVFDTKGFGAALNEFCPKWAAGGSYPDRIHGVVGNLGRRDIPKIEDDSILHARVAVAERDGEEGVAVAVLDRFDWHDVAVVLYGNDGNWVFTWSKLDEGSVAHIPFKNFQRLRERRYWRPGVDQIQSVWITAYVPDAEVDSGYGWRADHHGEKPAQYKESYINTVLWAETATWHATVD